MLTKMEMQLHKNCDNILMQVCQYMMGIGVSKKHLTRLGCKFWLLAGHLLSAGDILFTFTLHLKILQCVFTLLNSI